MAESGKTKRITVPQFLGDEGLGDEGRLWNRIGAEDLDADGVRLRHGPAVRRGRCRGHSGRRQHVDGRAGAREHAAGDDGRDDLPRRDGRTGRSTTRWWSSICRFPVITWVPAKAIENAGRILKETRCQAVKLEGGAAQADTIAALVSAGIPVMAHVGLRPQSVHQLGGYRVQRDENALLHDARAAAEAGAFAVVLECVPSASAKHITEKIEIPTIGIGAGPDCDGQVLVLNDILGLATDYVPRFVKAYADLKTEITTAARTFRDEVRDGTFPGPEHGYE